MDVILSASQIAGYARGAGFPENIIPKMVGIAIAESSGNTGAHNGIPPDDSYGLWQINMIGSLGPARRMQFGISSNDALYDPAINAHAAYIVSNGGANLLPWSTYQSGAYLKYVPSSIPVIDDLVQGIPGLASIPYSSYLILGGIAFLLLMVLFSGGNEKQTEGAYA